jgi:hypothetical protein
MIQSKKLAKVIGLISVLTSLLFFVNVLVLGIIQPGYNHFVDTISVLALGKWGWVQQINFFLLAIAIASIGLSLSIVLTKKVISFLSSIFIVFGLSIVSLIWFSADAVDRTRIKLTQMNSLEGLIHISLTLLIIIFTIPVSMFLVKKMKQHNHLKKYARYTAFVFIFTFLSGILWFICRRAGILFEWKGLWQKTIAANVLVWIVVMGNVIRKQSTF